MAMCARRSTAIVRSETSAMGGGRVTVFELLVKFTKVATKR
jgi:hypothetical protein